METINCWFLRNISTINRFEEFFLLFSLLFFGKLEK